MKIVFLVILIAAFVAAYVFWFYCARTRKNKLPFWTHFVVVSVGVGIVWLFKWIMDLATQ